MYNYTYKLILFFLILGAILMAVVIPMSRIYGEPQANLINNNAIDNVQFDLNRQLTQTLELEGIWRSSIYSKNKGLYVAVGTNITVYSQDGKNFTKGTIPNGNWQSITYAEDKGLFVAIGYVGLNNNGIVAYSTDGKSFTQGTIPIKSSTSDFWRSITYSKEKGIFVAVGGASDVGLLAYSTTGTSFTLGTIPNGIWSSIVYAKNKGLFVTIGVASGVVGASGLLAYSTTGTSFTTSSMITASWQSITYAEDKGLFVVVAGSSSGATASAIAYSTTGTSFTLGTIQSGNYFSITYAEDKGLFVAVGFSGTITMNPNGLISYSQDGKNFTKGIIPNGAYFSSIYIQDKGRFIVIGNNVLAISSTGTIFTNIIISTERTSVVVGQGVNPFLITGNELLTTNTTIDSGRNFSEGTFSSLSLKITNGFYAYGRYTFDNTTGVFTGYDYKYFGYNGSVDIAYLISNNGRTLEERSEVNPLNALEVEFYSRTKTSVSETIPMTQYIGETIINKWKDGRMSINFDCDYSAQYYDEQGNPTNYTGTNGQLLKMQEEIILWDDRMNRNTPLIKNADGSARKFRITSNEMQWDGVVMQRISALEYK